MSYVHKRTRTGDIVPARATDNSTPVVLKPRLLPSLPEAKRLGWRKQSGQITETDKLHILHEGGCPHCSTKLVERERKRGENDEYKGKFWACPNRSCSVLYYALGYHNTTESYWYDPKEKKEETVTTTPTSTPKPGAPKGEYMDYALIDAAREAIKVLGSIKALAVSVGPHGVNAHFLGKVLNRHQTASIAFLARVQSAVQRTLDKKTTTLSIVNERVEQVMSVMTPATISINYNDQHLEGTPDAIAALIVAMKRLAS